VNPTNDANSPSAHDLERRKHPRYSIDIAIKVKVPGAGGVSTYCFGRGGDVGQGGLSIHLPHELVVGKTIDLTLTLPYTNRAIQCRVVVRNREGFKYGVEFKELLPDDHELLMETCRRLGVLQAI
jgi:hypothetical protein